MNEYYTEKWWIAKRIDARTYQLAHEGVMGIEKCGKIKLYCSGFEVALRPAMILNEYDLLRIYKILHQMNIDRNS